MTENTPDPRTTGGTGGTGGPGGDARGGWRSGGTGAAQLDRVLADLGRLRRSRTDRVAAGVCAGVGRSLGVDPVLLRVVVGVLALFGGSGIILYVAGWLLIPEEGYDRSILDRHLGPHLRGHRHGERTSAVVLGICALIAIGVTSAISWGPPWQALVLVALVVAGVAALARRGSEDGTAAAGTAAPGVRGTGAEGTPGPGTDPVPGPGPDDPAGPGGTDPGGTDSPSAGPRSAGPLEAEPGPEFWDQPDPLGLRTDTGGGPSDPDAGAGPAAAPTAPPDPEGRGGRRSVLFPVTVGGALVATGVLSAVAGAGHAVPPAAYVAAALGVVGLGLVVGTWYGRSRGLVALGVLLGLALVPTTALNHITLGDLDGLPRHTILPRSAEDVRPAYRFNAGSAQLDLSTVRFDRDENTTPLRTSLDLGAGSLLVTVPRKVDVDVRTDVGMGRAVIFGRSYSGPGQSRHVRDPGPDGPGGGRLRLDLHVGAGSVVVRRG